MGALEVLSAISDAGVIGLLIVILYGGSKGWWVYGSHFRTMQQERDKWEALALSTTSLAERAVEKITEPRRGD